MFAFAAGVRHDNRFSQSGVLADLDAPEWRAFFRFQIDGLQLANKDQSDKPFTIGLSVDFDGPVQSHRQLRAVWNPNPHSRRPEISSRLRSRKSRGARCCAALKRHREGPRKRAFAAPGAIDSSAARAPCAKPRAFVGRRLPVGFFCRVIALDRIDPAPFVANDLVLCARGVPVC